MYVTAGAMMPVPSFDARGLLPPYIGTDETTWDRSPYRVTMLEFVSTFATTAIRCNIMFGLIKYRQLLASFGYVDGEQFIDGSFVEDVELRESRDPGDVDVFSFLIRPVAYRNDVNLWQTVGFPQWSDEIVDVKRNKARFSVDSYAVAIDQHGASGVVDSTIYWYSLFSHKKLTHDWKGFVRIALNPSDDQAALDAIISGP